MGSQPQREPLTLRQGGDLLPGKFLRLLAWAEPRQWLPLALITLASPPIEKFLVPPLLARDKQAKELKSMNLENVHPLDYLNFYSLENWEKIPDTMAGSRDTEIAMGAYQLHHTLGERSSNM
ncbi:unnamed protein product [Prunus armeniaca]|uniref:Uncharacterized protein n=1 Tax=Prunus armeniaca TaxID=36596 RepID=A0A6J5XIM0_PRUAR|nr:unnamed protein product [Prunus armeniaca]